MSEKKREQPKTLPAMPLEASNRARHGPEPERLKISGYPNWEDAAAKLVRARKPPGGWPKK